MSLGTHVLHAPGIETSHVCLHSSPLSHAGNGLPVVSSKPSQVSPICAFPDIDFFQLQMISSV